MKLYTYPAKYNINFSGEELENRKGSMTSVTLQLCLVYKLH